MEEEIKKEKIYGFRVNFKKTDKKGFYYLRKDLQKEEAKTLLEAAKLRGRAEFEDDQDRDWTLLYDKRERTFTLLRRQRE